MQKRRERRDDKAQEIDEVPEAKASGVDLEEVDALLDEIDDLLEEQAREEYKAKLKSINFIGSKVDPCEEMRKGNIIRLPARLVDMLVNNYGYKRYDGPPCVDC